MRDSWASMSTHLASMVVLDHHPEVGILILRRLEKGTCLLLRPFLLGHLESDPWWRPVKIQWFVSYRLLVGFVFWDFCAHGSLIPIELVCFDTCAPRKSNKCIDILTIFISSYTMLFQGFDNIPGEHGIPQNSQQFIKVFLSCWGSGMSGFCYVASFLKFCFHDKYTINLQIDLPNNELVSRRATKGAQWYRQCRKCTAKPAVARRKRAGESRLKKSCCFCFFQLDDSRELHNDKAWVFLNIHEACGPSPYFEDCPDF